MSNMNPPVRHARSPLPPRPPSSRQRPTLRIAVIVLLVALGSIVVPGRPAGAAMTGIEPGIAAQFLDELNAERSARGIAPFALDTAITPSATAWAERMASRGGISHSDDPYAEIVARGQRTGQITEAWMKSSGHRNLVVDPNLGFAGVGVACDRNGQIFAVVQFRRIDTRLGTQSSSATSPVVAESDDGLTCSDAPVDPTNSVKRLYSAYFLRSADRAGLDYWKRMMASGMSLGMVSDSFSGSEEFVGRYGSLSNRAFVSLVYQNVMGRDADRAGRDYWVDQLRRGMTRGEMMVNFSESPEYRNRTGLR